MALDTMRDLLVDELRDLYSAERQAAAALPRLLHAATDDRLADCLRDRLTQTDARVDRLEAVLESLGAPPGGQRCRAMEGIVMDSADLLLRADEPRVRDAGLIAQVQRMEHYGIAAYSAAKLVAQHLGRSRVATVLDLTLKELIGLVRALAVVADLEVNPRAALVGAEGGLEM